MSSGDHRAGALHERTRWVYSHLPHRVLRLLDAGCHDGEGTAAYAARADLAVGVDLDAASLATGLSRDTSLRLAAADATALPFPDSTFDCVVFSEVLEHLPAEAETQCIAELRRVTCQGGTLLLTTPHRGTFWWLDPLMTKTHMRRAAGALRGTRPAIKGHKHYAMTEIQDLLRPYFDILSVSRVGWLLYPLAYWGHLLPLGIGQHAKLVGIWQRMMDIDYSHDRGDSAYNLCVVARAR